MPSFQGALDLAYLNPSAVPSATEGITVFARSDGELVKKDASNNIVKPVSEWEPGDIKASGRSAPSDGWLLCDGREVSRPIANGGTTDLYARLWSAITTTYGAGNGTTTFNIPDGRDRALLGASATKALGTSGGTDTVTKTDLPAHAHTLSSHVHDIGHDHNQTSTDGSHRHLVQLDATTGGGINSVARGTNSPTAGSYVNPISPGGGDSNSNHAHNIPALSGKNSAGPSNNLTGNSDATAASMSIQNPYFTGNYFIKY